ncbi:SDR family NAD(P)-dependent oxidoreductase [Gordonia terrae]
MGKLDGRVALITGAASGIGRAQAMLFAQEGARVIVADRDTAGAEKVAGTIRDGGGSATSQTLDVTDNGQVAAAIDAIASQHGTIDVLSNTAGMFDNFSPSLDTSPEHWAAVFGVNITGLFAVTNAVLPHMISQRRGVIVNIASGAGLRGGGGGAAYTSSKHAVVGYTKQLASDYGRKGIRANAIAPGLIDTPMVAAFSSDPDTVAGLQSQPAGRLGTPDDIARAALFLVSDDSDFIHAVTLPVDGGLTETL